MVMKFLFRKKTACICEYIAAERKKKAEVNLIHPFLFSK